LLTVAALNTSLLVKEQKMSELAVTVVVIEQGQILLIQRQDLKIWALPGGAIEPGESVTQAAIREVREETGLEVELTRLVGLYARPQWIGSPHSAIFAARPIGGSLRPQPEEVLALQYVSPSYLPEPFLWWHRQPILDAMQEVGGSVVWTQHVSWPTDLQLTPQAVYTLRDQQGIPDDLLHEAWIYLGRHPQAEDQVLEVGDKSRRA
jgi:8-oxo-dGTP pyrophosphatase MutT (NUDIX family)